MRHFLAPAVFIVGALACCTAEPDAPAARDEGPVFLNEAQSRNTITILDERGAFADWLELFNASDEEIALEGYALEDNGVGRREFPKRSVIAARGHLLVIANDATNGGTALEPQFPFKLNGDEGGDELLLIDPAGVIISRLTMPPIAPDTAFGRAVDGGDAFVVLPNPTPRTTNTCTRPFDVAPTVVINEALPFSDDASGLADDEGEVEPWFELFNRGAADVDLAGIAVTDRETLLRWEAPSVVLAAGAYLVVFADGEPDEGELHAPFRAQAEDGALDLGELCGSIYQRLSLAGASVGISAILTVDGETLSRTTDTTPTPGATNQ